MLPKKEYCYELIVDCNGSECCLVHEDTKEQKLLCLTAILLLITSDSKLTERYNLKDGHPSDVNMGLMI